MALWRNTPISAIDYNGKYRGSCRGPKNSEKNKNVFSLICTPKGTLIQVGRLTFPKKVFFSHPNREFEQIRFSIKNIACVWSWNTIMHHSDKMEANDYPSSHALPSSNSVGMSFARVIGSSCIILKSWNQKIPLYEAGLLHVWGLLVDYYASFWQVRIQGSPFQPCTTQL